MIAKRLLRVMGYSLYLVRELRKKGKIYEVG